MKVEPKSASGGFGSALPRQTMSFGEFVDTVQTKEGENLYLTTQYRDDEEGEDADLDDGILYQMLHEYCPPPLPPMLPSFPQRPSLLGNLVPQQVNLWVGNSANGTSSGLHHDFHDNLYLLLQGSKRFTLFSPADAFNLYMHGKITKVHTNGLINYANREPTRADGATDGDLAQHKIEQLEAILDNMDEDAIAGGPERAAIEAQLAAAEEAALDLVDPFDVEDDDFDEMMDDIMDDVEMSDEDDDEEDTRESRSKSTKKKASPHPKNQKGKKSKLLVEEVMEEMEELDEEEDDEEENGDMTEEPNSFSKISVAELHHPTKETYSKFPLLKKAIRTTVQLKPGEMLYLPTGWFHEVTSSNGSSKSAPHVAFNYWMHPPVTFNYTNPYEDNYWQSQWKEMVELISDIEATIRTGKRPLSVEQELDHKEYIPHSKRQKVREAEANDN